MKYRLENESTGALSVIDFSITSLKVLLKSKSVCWPFDMRVPAGPLHITRIIQINSGVASSGPIVTSFIILDSNL